LYYDFNGNWQQIWASNEFKQMNIPPKKFQNHIKAQLKKMRKNRPKSADHEGEALQDQIQKRSSTPPLALPAKKQKQTPTIQQLDMQETQELIQTQSTKRKKSLLEILDGNMNEEAESEEKEDGESAENENLTPRVEKSDHENVRHQESTERTKKPSITKPPE
jgi:hypothetical protein